MELGTRSLVLRFRELLPKGGSLPDEVWQRRHRAILVLLFAHVGGLLVYGTLTGHGLGRSAIESSPVMMLAITASLDGVSRLGRSIAASIGLVLSSAILVHFSGGLIEMHFHFFVMVGVISLYYEWAPFLMAIGFVIVHNGAMGALSPESVFNHVSASRNPWQWSGIHAAFLLSSGIVSLAAWRASESYVRDPLTQLPNRILLFDRIEQALARAKRGRFLVGALLIDLDGFKVVNDTLGHDAGDQLLKGVSERLTLTLRRADSVGRLGGDEFVAFVEGIDPDGPWQAAMRIQEALRAPFAIKGREVFIGASIGIAKSHGDHTVENFLHEADVAMYSAKNRGRSRVEVFHQEMHSESTDRIKMHNDLKRAFARREFHLVYQPIVDLGSSAVIGAEALLRWDHPDGLVSPADFIPLAEETGLIVPIGRWVLIEACSTAASWQRAGKAMKIAVNVSARQLAHPDIIEDVSFALRVSGLDPSLLKVEITESSLVADKEAALVRLNELKSLGIEIAVDDFGTGYSSLSYLQQFPIDVLKIDRSFVTGVADGPEESSLARAIVTVGHGLGLKVVGEGIEENEQSEALLAMSCDFGQGYLFGRPESAEAMALRIGISASTPSASHQRVTLASAALLP